VQLLFLLRTALDAVGHLFDLTAGQLHTPFASWHNNVKHAAHQLHFSRTLTE
jgi:hypothetical protein